MHSREKNTLFIVDKSVKVSKGGSETFLSPAAFDCQHSGLYCRCHTAVSLSWQWQAINPHPHPSTTLHTLTYTHTHQVSLSQSCHNTLTHTTTPSALRCGFCIDGVVKNGWLDSVRTYQCIYRQPVSHQGTWCSQNSAAGVNFMASCCWCLCLSPELHLLLLVLQCFYHSLIHMVSKHGCLYHKGYIHVCECVCLFVCGCGHQEQQLWCLRVNDWQTVYYICDRATMTSLIFLWISVLKAKVCRYGRRHLGFLSWEQPCLMRGLGLDATNAMLPTCCHSKGPNP